MRRIVHAIRGISLFVLFSLLFLSCVNHIESSNTCPSVELSFSGKGKNVPFLISDMIDSISYLVIDSSKLVGKISNVKYVGGYYYILDGASRIHRIDELGNILYSLEKKGRGPGEYLSITYFDIDSETDDIFVFDQVGWKLLRYSSQGDYLWSRKINNGCDDSMILSESSFINYFPHWNGMPNSKRGLWIDSYDGTQQKIVFEYDDNHRYALTDPFLLCFRRFDRGTIGIYNPIEDKIVHVYPDGKVCDALSLSFDRIIPPSVLKGQETVDPFDDNRVYTVTQYYETDHWVLVSAICAQHRTDLFYDKMQGVAHVVKNNGDLVLDVSGLVPRDWWWSSGDRLIAPFYPDKSSELSRQMFPDMDETSNPILVIAHVK